MAESTPRKFTRRTFIGWQIAVLLTSTVVVGLAPILVFLWPAPPKGQKKGPLPVSLPKSINELADGDVVVKTAGNVSVLAINCSHLGCSVALNQDARTFDCPCHGSRFHLDGNVLHGPAAYPLSHLTWAKGKDANTIDVDGITLGF